MLKSIQVNYHAEQNMLLYLVLWMDEAEEMKKNEIKARAGTVAEDRLNINSTFR